MRFNVATRLDLSRHLLLLVLAVFLITGPIQAPASAQGYADLVAQIRLAVVFIRVVERNGTFASGSGFFIHPDGYILTAHHVIIGAQRVFVRLAGGVTQEARVVDSNGDTDSALLKIPGSNYPTLPLGLSRELRQGDEVLVFGYPGGLALGVEEVTVTRGIVGAIRFGGLLVQIDAAINPGNSGGPVVDMEGRTVAMAFARSPMFSGINFAVSIDAAGPLFSRIPGGLPQPQTQNPSLLRPPLPQSDVWSIFPGLSVGPLRLGMFPDTIQSIVGSPDIICTDTTDSVRPLPGYPEVKYEMYFPRLGLELTFTAKEGLKYISISSDTERRIVQKDTSMEFLGFSIERACNYYGIVRMRVTMPSPDVAGITLGTSVDDVYRALGKPDKVLPNFLMYFSKGISFGLKDGKVDNMMVSGSIPIRPQ